MSKTCSFCHALHWKAESLTSSTREDFKFGMCCYQGKISLPPLEKVPPELSNFLIGEIIEDDVQKEFHKQIRNYNSALSMTSVGRKVDDSLNRAGGGPYSFRLHGELIHRAGSLLPQPGNLPDDDGPISPTYAQLYIHDSDAALAHRMSNRYNVLNHLNPATMRTLQDMLYRLHPSVQHYKQAYLLTRNMPPDQQCQIALRFQANSDIRRYQNPNESVSEIAVILPGDGDTPADCQDIILYRKHGEPLQRIRDDHPLYPSLRYVLLFPTGQLGWHPKIPYRALEAGNPQNEKFTSFAEYFRYRLHIRPTEIESNHLFLCGKLFQEFICESWALAEQKRLYQLRSMQKTLRHEVYNGLVDAVSSNDNVELGQLGKKFILPSSFAGSTRNMQQHCQDALAINRYFGGGDLFITMTANPKWPEISDNLLHGQSSSDRPDLVVRVFHAKLHSLIQDIKKGALGDIAGFLYTIEFQKRGLPHAHIVVFLKPHAKLRTPEQIDSLMSSEFPLFDDQLLELIKSFMVHTPCGPGHKLDAPCIVNGSCSKNFPKPFREHTTVNEDSYACTRRTNTAGLPPDDRLNVRGFQPNQPIFQLDNQWVVCHSRYLIWKYRCHINVESIASIKAIKYIYKYVYKGHDRTTMEFGTCVDEIKQYLDARYVSACEASWRLYFFELQKQEPSVRRLHVHLPGQHNVAIDPERHVNAEQAIEEAKDSTLMAWFKANAEAPADGDIRNTLYQDFPSKMVWQKDKWVPRTRGFQIGRMYYAHPSSGERFYLRLLLTTVKGATSFEELYSFEGTVYPSFREACIARGLLDNDNEWHQCLQDASHMQAGCQLRQLFATILKEGSPADPRALWDTYWPHICDDVKPLLRRILGVDPSEAQIQDYGLYLLDQLLHQFGKKLQDWNSMPEVVGNWRELAGNPLIAEQRQYNLNDEARLAAQCIASLNIDQRSAFDKITSAITNKTGEIFFLHGPGGTGKTYLYNTLCYHLRSQAKIVLCAASSGIAALLLKGGRTAHSSFKIPIPCHETTLCNFRKNSHLADLISHSDTELVIWDEAPMHHRHIVETVDRTFQDLRDSTKLFGGLTVVFGGDFQQTLPIIPKGSRAQIVGGCLQRSPMWRSITVLHLHQNMRLNTAVEAEANFAQWQLDVGQGKHTDEHGNISLPDLFRCRENTIDSLIDAIYPGINTLTHPATYFAERAILSCLNKEVDRINLAVLERFPGPTQTFHSADYIPTSDQSGENDPLLNYPTEYLHKIDCSGLPLAKLQLKIGCPVIILKNLDPSHGVCNGSRGILTRCTNRVLEVKLLTGFHAGETVFIPRVYNQPTEEQNAFKFTRKQFPVRLCFSMTINKSQGQTLKYVGLDLRYPVFTHGQFYVAVSRVTSVENIKAIWDEKDREGKTKNIVYSEVLLT